MIKTWSKFNESSSDGLRSQLEQKLLEVREVFTDFEDIGIITYGLIASGYERGGFGQFDPKRGDFQRFLDQITPSVKFARDKEYHGGSPEKKSSLSDREYCIICDLKIPGQQNEFGSTVINSEGIKLFEDILVANSRLIDMGYDVKLDLNASHNAYKPVKFLIYFNI